ncbi:fibronectin type III domain-containing protein [bacterium]|nr:MAG: fibronectin type III domain-containing protein [bacterium]
MRREFCLLLVLAIVGCGENQESTSPSTQFGPPENLKALSVNSSTVGLQWTPPSGQPDSLGGYVVQWGNNKDTLGKTAVSYLADSLTQGEKTFTVYARRVSGTVSDGAVIKWEPADRFDSP